MVGGPKVESVFEYIHIPFEEQEPVVLYVGNSLNVSSVSWRKIYPFSAQKYGYQCFLPRSTSCGTSTIRHENIIIDWIKRDQD